MKWFNFGALSIVLTLITSCVDTKNQINVLFDRVDGLKSGSGVISKGLTIGYVKRLDLLGNKVLVTIDVEPDVKISKKSTFSVSEHILGDSFVEIELSPSTDYLRARDTVLGVFRSKEGVFDKLMSDSTKQKEVQRSLDKIASGLGELVNHLNDSTKK